MAFHVDMAAVLGRKRAMVSGLNDMYLDNYKQTGAEFILGSGRFVGPKTLEVTLPGGTTRRLRGANVIVSTGTRAALEPIPGLAEAQPLTHIEALELDQVPGHLIVLGGGYVGLELSQAMRRFGSKVTVIDHNDRLLHREDDDVTKALADLFTDEGIDTVLNARAIRISGKSGDSVTVVVEQGGREKTLAGTHLLVAAGRRPNTENLGLESAGIEVTDRGYIKVNERLETTAPGVWAIGEVAGSPQFTHVSVDDFRVVRDNLEGGNHVTTGRLIPYTLFTDPELARVGLNEKEAKARGMAYRLFKIPMERVLRARTVSETRGFLKALVEVAGNRILGFTAFAVDAGEIMASVQTAMIGRIALYRTPRCHLGPPDSGRRARSIVLVRAFAIGRYTSEFGGHGARPSLIAKNRPHRAGEYRIVERRYVRTNLQKEQGSVRSTGSACHRSRQAGGFCAEYAFIPCTGQP